MTGKDAHLHDRVHVEEIALQVFKDGVAGLAQAVAPDPLQIPDPEGHLGELVGVGVHLDAVKLPGMDEGQGRLEAPVGGPVDGLLLQVFHFLQGDIKEVARAAGRVEHGDRAQVPEEVRHGGGGAIAVLHDGGRGVLVPPGFVFCFALVQQVLGLGLGFAPRAAQGGHDHGLHEGLDVLPARVVRPELGALGRVQSPLEERAENGGIHGAPVQAGGLHQHLELGLFEEQSGARLEEAAVEAAHRVHAEVAARGHGVEELDDGLAEALGVGLALSSRRVKRLS